MSLIAHDGFESITTAQAARRGWTFVNSSSGSGTTIDASGGVIGQGLKVLGQSASVAYSASYAYRGFVASPNILCGFNFKRDSVSATDSRFLALAESGTQHLYFLVGSTGIISIYRGDGTLLGSTSTFAVTEDAWSFIEVDAYIDNAAGYVRLVIDGDEILNLTGIDTRNGGAVGTIDRLYLYCDTGGFPNVNLHYFDDLYILDDAGVEMNELLGPVRHDVVRPTGASGTNDFTPSAGANWQNVDDTTPDDDGTYNESAVDTDADDFVLANLPDDSLTIFAVTVRVVVKRADAGVANIATRLTSGATTEVSATAAVGASYEEVSTTYTKNPDGDVDWDDAAISALIAGYERPA